MRNPVSIEENIDQSHNRRSVNTFLLVDDHLVGKESQRSLRRSMRYSTLRKVARLNGLLINSNTMT